MTFTPLPTNHDEPAPHPVRSVLIERRLTITQLAEAIGYSMHHVSDVIGKRRPAPRRMCRAIAEALQLPESDLFDAEWCHGEGRTRGERS